MGMLTDEFPVANFFNFDSLEDDIKSLIDAFSGIADINHAVAVKANPVSGILARCKKLGLGAECASVVEVRQAINLKFEHSKIVYDCPCKSETELRQAMALGCYINIDSFSEIEMIARMPKSLVKLSTFGVRVNPVIGAGTIGVTSTAASGSKFGIELVYGAK